MPTVQELRAQGLDAGWKARFVGTLLLIAAVVLLLVPVRATVVGAMASNGDRISQVRYEGRASCDSPLQHGPDGQVLLHAGGSATATLRAQQEALACETAKAGRLRWALLVALAGGIAFVMAGRRAAAERS